MQVVPAIMVCGWRGWRANLDSPGPLPRVNLMPNRFQRTGGAALLDSPDRIRPADPDDSAFLAEAILHASRSHLERGLWDFVFEGSDEERLSFLEVLTLIDARSFCHFSNFIIAEGVDAPAATLSAFDPGEPGLMPPGQLIAAAFEEIGASESEVTDAYRRLESYQPGVPEQKRGIWTIEWVWTTPSMRRRGLQASLMERILAAGRERGYRRAQVTTFIGNAAAIRAYEMSGFHVGEEKRDPEFRRLTGAPGLVRYERDL